MCGIAGSVNHKLAYNSLRAAMLHRGPDGQNGYSTGPVDFYHLRLSIQDIAGGAQPMHLGDRYSIIFNGEIYNHTELRKKYDINGQTHSDTETILHLYAKLGPDFLHQLDGMFAMAIYDQKQNKLFLARDRAGKKPLYYYTKGKQFVFASELNALKSQLPLEIETAHIDHYFRLGVFYRSMTPYKYVAEMPAGTWMEIDCDSLAIREERWWDIHQYYRQSSSDGLEEALRQTEDRLQRSIRRRLESSDLEVGCFLSGGIDSGLITAMASKMTSKLKTFTVSFAGEYNEAPLAKLVADQYNTDHTEIKISFNNLVNDIEKILCNYGEPFFDSSAIPSYYVSQAARKHLTVILNGDGADELFAGYRRYVPFARYDFFNAHSFVRASALAIKKILPPSAEKKSTYNFLYRLASFASKSNLETYLSAGLDIIEDYESNIINTSDYLQPLRTDFSRIASSPLSGLKKIMNMDFDTNLFSDLLVKMDIATMAHSLEGRSPFLGKELLEYAPTLNDSLKIRGGTTKFLLRTLAKEYLPADLINQPKRGFEIPLKKWIDHELRDMIQDYVGSPSAYHRSFIKPAFTEQLLANTAPVPAEKRAKILWTIFCLEVWYKKVYLA